MIQIRAEGQPIKQGLSFWPWSDAGSLGFILRFGQRVVWVRRSTHLQRWTCATWRCDEVVEP